MSQSLIKIKMSHYRKSHKYQKDKLDLGIQSEPVSEPMNVQSLAPGPVKSVILSKTPGPLIKKQKINSLLENIEKIESQTRVLNEKLKTQQKQERRSLNLNMMKLQDKHFHIDKNIYNIAVGQIFSKETYLSNLNRKIQEMRSRIRQLEEEEEEQMNRTIQLEQPLQENEYVPERSMTIQTRKSQCGRLYSRNGTPSSDRRHLKVKNKDSERSSYYKWQPNIDETLPVNQSKSNQLVRSGKNRYTENSAVVQTTNEKDKQYINYRVKQRSAKPPMSSKEGQSSLGGQRSKQKVELEGRQKFKTDQFSTPSSKKADINPEVSLSAEKGNKSSEVEEVYLEPYSGIMFKDMKQFQIKNINDDFRYKILQQLQTPEGFPLDAPELGLTIEQIQELGQRIFSVFGVNIKRESKKLVSRKFKNGVYYHIGETKNILWYFSGSFYLGGWDTDLPTEGQKNGFGFQYIPEKYYYLGGFKDGMKHGKGVIKMFPTNPSTPQLFMAYEGQWQNGKPHGLGKHIDQSNTRYIGSFVTGQKTGSATILTKQGQLYEGGVIKGVKNGYGVEKLINGDIFKGSFQAGNFHGKGLYHWKNGSTYEGEFFQGKRQGKGLWKGTNGDIFEGQYFDDLKNGWGKFVWTNGQIYEGQFRNDIRHGEGTYRHPCGKLGRFMWNQGKIDYRLYCKQEQEYRSRKMNHEESRQRLEFSERELIQ